MFWKNKKPSERELTLVNSLITAMKNDPDGWEVSSRNDQPRLYYTEYLDDSKQSRNQFVYAPSKCGISKLTYNCAELELAPANIKRLDETAFELLREKMIRSIANIQEKNDHTNS